ncbi:MAG: acyl-CoA transferase, partial [Roseovarius sp.]|nr:acyl-CoA transferase [Roseovarius sp.]
GAALPESVPANGLIILRDGDPGEPEFTLSPLTYHYEHRAEIEAVVLRPDNDAAFDALVGPIGAVIIADRTLGGAVEWAEVEAPAPQDLPGDNGGVIKAAIIGVVLHYSTSDPLN